MEGKDILQAGSSVQKDSDHENPNTSSHTGQPTP